MSFQSSHYFTTILSVRDQQDSRKSLGLDNFWPVSTSLSVDIETGIEKVSVLVSTLRPEFPKSQSRSQDSNLGIANPCQVYQISN
jgi:hypothetical protein